MSIKNEIASLIIYLRDKKTVVLSSELRFNILEKLQDYEDLYYELEKWKQNYQFLEKTVLVKANRCMNYHLHNAEGKLNMIKAVKQSNCGKCLKNLKYDTFSERYKSDKFLCDICLKIHHVSTGIFTCIDCKFDVCSSCIENVNLPDLTCLKCGYNIDYIHCLGDPYKKGQYFCNVCNMPYLDVAGVYHCEKCGNDVCNNCESELKKKIVFNQKRDSPFREILKKAGIQDSSIKEKKEIKKKSRNNSINYVLKFDDFDDKNIKLQNEEEILTFNPKKSKDNFVYHDNYPIVKENNELDKLFHKTTYYVDGRPVEYGEILKKYGEKFFSLPNHSSNTNPKIDYHKPY